MHFSTQSKTKHSGFLLSVFLLCSCQKQAAIREYVEISPQVSPLAAPSSDPLINSMIDPSPGPIIEESGPAIEVTWNTEKSWMKKAANPLRIGSYDIAVKSGKNIDLSISKLAGQGGGLQQNIRRWANQIGIHFTPAELSHFVDSTPMVSIQSGEKAKILDFTTILSGDMRQQNSILGCIVEGDNYMVFVKASGLRSDLVSIKNSIDTLCRSLQIKAGSTTGQ